MEIISKLKPKKNSKSSESYQYEVLLHIYFQCLKMLFIADCYIMYEQDLQYYHSIHSNGNTALEIVFPVK